MEHRLFLKEEMEGETLNERKKMDADYFWR